MINQDLVFMIFNFNKYLSMLSITETFFYCGREIIECTYIHGYALPYLNFTMSVDLYSIGKNYKYLLIRLSNY